MSKIQVTLDLPDPLAHELSRLGTLDPRTITTILQNAIPAHRIGNLKEARDRIAAANVPVLTMDEINSEVDADRGERRALAQGQGIST